MQDGDLAWSHYISTLEEHSLPNNTSPQLRHFGFPALLRCRTTSARLINALPPQSFHSKSPFKPVGVLDTSPTCLLSGLVLNPPDVPLKILDAPFIRPLIYLLPNPYLLHVVTVDAPFLRPIPRLLLNPPISSLAILMRNWPVCFHIQCRILLTPPPGFLHCNLELNTLRWQTLIPVLKSFKIDLWRYYTIRIRKNLSMKLWNLHFHLIAMGHMCMLFAGL